jgi:hypothetical protein
MFDMSDKSFKPPMMDKDISTDDVSSKLQIRAIPKDAEVLLTTTVNKT